MAEETPEKEKDMVDIRLSVQFEIKDALLARAKSQGIKLSELCRPALRGLANGEIFYKVVDNRGK